MEIIIYTTCFNTQPPEGGWVSRSSLSTRRFEFQHTAARRRLGLPSTLCSPALMFQHTAARRRLALSLLVRHGNITVSTHSRPKAAGRFYKRCSLSKPCFNTQPPEGGWKIKGFGTAVLQSFNTQPPEGGWMMCFLIEYTALVSTHSRPKAAGRLRKRQATWRQSFNTQPPEGGWKHHRQKRS